MKSLRAEYAKKYGKTIEIERKRERTSLKSLFIYFKF